MFLYQYYFILNIRLCSGINFNNLTIIKYILIPIYLLYGQSQCHLAFPACNLQHLIDWYGQGKLSSQTNDNLSLFLLLQILGTFSSGIGNFLTTAGPNFGNYEVLNYTLIMKGTINNLIFPRCLLVQNIFSSGYSYAQRFKGYFFLF